MGLDTKTYWLTDRQSQCDFDFDFESSSTKDRPVLSSDCNCQIAVNIWSWAPDGGSTPRLTDWLTVSRNVILTLALTIQFYQCGGWVEYLHRDPASRRRRRKGKSHIWDSKIWSRVQRDSDPRKTALARTSSIYKRQTRHQNLLTDRPSVAMWLWL
jgi:hypothetical protein